MQNQVGRPRARPVSAFQITSVRVTVRVRSKKAVDRHLPRQRLRYCSLPERRPPPVMYLVDTALPTRQADTKRAGAISSEPSVLLRRLGDSSSAQARDSGVR